ARLGTRSIRSGATPRENGAERRAVRRSAAWRTPPEQKSSRAWRGRCRRTPGARRSSTGGTIVPVEPAPDHRYHGRASLLPVADHPPPPRTRGRMNPADLDTILTLQLAVAWAGEGETRPPRLRWWRTALNDPG